jgi:hypothetical protein
MPAQVEQRRAAAKTASLAASTSLPHAAHEGLEVEAKRSSASINSARATASAWLSSSGTGSCVSIGGDLV